MGDVIWALAGVILLTIDLLMMYQLTGNVDLFKTLEREDIVERKI